MGLDMYAARRLYVKQWGHQKPSERYSVQLTKGGMPVSGIKPEHISDISEEVMYWRKANHIHKWFVDHVQGGTDDCGTYHVSWDDLCHLLDCCQRVLDASELVDGGVSEGTVYDAQHPEGRPLGQPGKVLKDATVAKQLLPTTTGFFFGSTEYDADYIDEVERTRDWCRQMSTDHEKGVPGDIYYHSSW